MANEKRLIDANAYCKELYLERDYPGRSEEFISAMEVAIADLGDMPTVDAVEVVHGRWIVKGQDLFCSHCDQESGHNPWGASAFSNYCPNCGASMMKGNG